MSNKLQELTDKLYAEGLSKGKKEGEEILRKANAEASRIIADAKEQAAAIVAAAGKEADELRKKAAGDIRMAATQSMTATRQEIENLIVAKAVGKAPADLLSGEEFVKEAIRSVVAAFNPAQSEPVDLDVVLPEKLKAAVEPYLRDVLSKEFKAEVHATYSKKINGGFTVGPRKGGYFISFTDEEFKELISAHLRPAARKILFGE